MDSIKLYHLHKEHPTNVHRDDSSKLHFEFNDAVPFIKKNAKHCFIPHRHAFYQIIWFKEEGKHHIDYKTYSHPANSIFFINKGQIHNFCRDSANEGYLFHFNDLFLNQNKFDNANWLQYKLFVEMSSPFFKLDERLLNQTNKIVTLISDEFLASEYNYKHQIYFLFQVLLLKIERIKREQYQELTDTKGEFGLMVQFRELIDKNMDKMLSINEYGDELGISTKKLTALTKRFFKETPANIIHEQKILEAKRLLSNTSLSIKEIAYELGFDQATYFTKYFKKYVGITPKEFMKTLD